MNTKSPAITGIGSVTPFGPLAGLIPPSPLEPAAITAWTTDGLRRAFVVTPFHPASVIPGLKTRRLDRLSAWSQVAASLALQDAGIDLAQFDRARVAVVFATSFGCIELTESFYQSAYRNGWSGTDPITFPETLANSPPGHVALFHNLRGPNITLSSKNFAGESAMLQAASLLRHGQADLAIVIAGDSLTQTMYQWYEAANLLAPACFNTDDASPIASNTDASNADLPNAVASNTNVSNSQSKPKGFIPSEGVVALVMEPAGRVSARTYAHLRTGRWATGGGPQKSIRQMLGSESPTLAICAGSGAPCATDLTTESACRTAAPNAKILPAQPVAAGLTDSGALLHLVLALSAKPPSGPALMLATSGTSGFAALLLDLP